MTLRQNLDVSQGETFSWSFIHKDASGSAVDLTGYHARMAVRYSLFAAQNAYLTDDATTLGGSIALGTTNGKVTINLTAAQSDSLDQSNLFLYDFLYGNAVDVYGKNIDFIYDLELVSPVGVVKRAIEGFLTLHRAVTG